MGEAFRPRWSSPICADEDDTADEKARLDDALADDDTLKFLGTMGDLARTRGMSVVARRSGLSRENLYRAVSGERDAYFTTVVKVLRALGYRLRVERRVDVA